jgi:hypothetical protein
MIVDCHSHIWPSADQLGQATGFSCLTNPEVPEAGPDAHRQSCEPADFALVLGFVSNLLNAEIPHDFVRDYVRSAPNRLFGFAGIDPTESGCVRHVKTIQEEGDFAGLAVSPACQGFHPSDSRAMRVYGLAEEQAMPVYFLQGDKLPQTAFMEFLQPSALDEVAKTFSNLKIVVSHLGYPWIEQMIMLLGKHDNVFADIAGLAHRPWQAYRALTLAYEYGVTEKLLFASDFPNSTVKESVEAIYNLNKLTLDSVLPAIPREQLRGIVERDSLSLLGLGHPDAKPDSGGNNSAI